MKKVVKSMLEIVKAQVKALKFSHIRKQVSCPAKWYGNEYGGFYVNPNLIEQNGIVYSFGIGEDISFDLDMINAHDCQVFGFDPTPKSVQWCENQDLPDNFHFYAFGIDKISGKVMFHLPANPNHVSGSTIVHANVNVAEKVEVEMKSFMHIHEMLGHRKIDVLKMDIEGTEYEVIESILKAVVDIPQIVIEFHERFFSDGKSKTKSVIKAMNSKGYKIFAISKSYEEISFIKTKAL